MVGRKACSSEGMHMERFSRGFGLKYYPANPAKRARGSLLSQL